MVKRKRIALSYYYNENWIGGTYYIENLVNALNLLKDEEKPYIIVLTENWITFKILKSSTNYPYLKYQVSTGEKNLIFQFINRVSNRLIKSNLFSRKIPNLSAAFPFSECEQFALAEKKIFWIPDFQEHFTPFFFSEAEIKERSMVKGSIAKSLFYLLLSSKDAFNHFNRFYPLHTVKVEVIPFAVTHPPFKNIMIGSLLEKYGLPEEYFICPNQFWKHKNQLLVLKALAELKRKDITVRVVFTGKPHDRRNPEYYNELEDYIIAQKLSHQVKLLGFIDRADQLQLMNYSIAVIQPSFFEGWSTVVEDAKSMNKFLIVSDISVHREQLNKRSALFFDPYNASELAEAMSRSYYFKKDIGLCEVNNYSENIRKFGKEFLTFATTL